MCLATPGQIVSRDRQNHAVVSFNGVKKKTNISLVPEAKPGDWVSVHAGFAIGKISSADARKNQELIDDYQTQKRD